MPAGFYWHVQDLTLGEASVGAAVGIARHLGIEALVPFRHVVSRVHFLDADRTPLERPEGDIHHRNETLAGIADPWLMFTILREVVPRTMESSMSTTRLPSRMLLTGFSFTFTPKERTFCLGSMKVRPT